MLTLKLLNNMQAVNGTCYLSNTTQQTCELKDVDAFMEQDLDRILRVVSGTVVKSRELYEYMYGPQRVSFEAFCWMATDRQKYIRPDQLGPSQGVTDGMVSKIMYRMYTVLKCCVINNNLDSLILSS